MVISQKKYGVELYRFIITITVCLHHFRLYAESVLPYGGGYLGVDFFFIVSGFFLYEHSQRRSAHNASEALKEAAKYTIQRYQRLFPQYLFILIISIVTYGCVMDVRLGFSQLGALISKLLMIDGIYVHSQLNIMPQGWYCSSLLFGSALIYYLCIRYKQNFVKRLAPFFIIGIYALFFFKYGNLNLYTQYGFVITIGCLRGIAGLCLGCVLHEFIKNKTIPQLKSKGIAIPLFGVLTAVILYALLWNSGYSRSDFIFLLILFVILYCLLGDSNIGRLLDTPFFGKLGKISYPMFLVHHLIAVLFDYFDWFRGSDWKIASLMYLGVVLVCSGLLCVRPKHS